MIGWERYRLVLHHEFVDTEGKRHNLEKPIVTEMVIDDQYSQVPVPVIVNEMINKLSHYVLEEVSK